jgi:hypothetical protein
VLQANKDQGCLGQDRVKCIGLYPRVQVDTNGTGVVSQAGGVLLVETARAGGVDRALSTASASPDATNRSTVAAITGFANSR